MLQHPPVQGKAALDRLLNEVSSPYFPRETDKAIEYLTHRPLQRPRDSLVRNFVIVLLKTIFKEADPVSMFRYTAALNAVRQMKRELTEKTLTEHFNELLRTVDDNSLWLAVHALAQLSDLWPFIKEDVRTRLEEFVRSGPSKELILYLDEAFDIDGLRKTALERLALISANDLAPLVAKTRRPEYADRAI